MEYFLSLNINEENVYYKDPHERNKALRLKQGFWVLTMD